MSVLEHEGARRLVAAHGAVGWARNVRGRAADRDPRGASEETRRGGGVPEEAAPVLPRYAAANP